jgi:cyclopropane-fatty-acyl-phospholipid synthase
MSSGARDTIAKYFAASGVEVDGSKPTDIQVRDTRFYTRVLAEGSIGFGESYMDGWWEAENLDGFITLLLHQKLDQAVRSWGDLISLAWARLTNLQRRGRAFQVGERHYDIGNDLYERMLDRRMIYSCAYWEGVDTLDAAQENKLA